MILSDIEFHLVEVPCHAPAAPIRTVVARLTTHDGHEGWGEAFLPWRWSELVPRREAMLPILTGRSVFDIEELRSHETFREQGLRCLVGMACWDLIGRITGQPVCRLLGGEYRHRVPVAVRLPHESGERIATRARELAGGGLHWQVIEATGDARIDGETVEAVREAVGSRVEIRFDGARRYDLETARDLCERLEAASVRYFIDPLKADVPPDADPSFASLEELDALATLARQTSLSLAVERGVQWPSDVLAAVQCKAGEYLSIDVQGVGGVLGAKKCGIVAHAAGLRTALGGPPTLGIAAAAALQVAACTPAITLGVASAHDIRQDDVIEEPIEVVDGMATVPLGPGLGVDVDRAKVEALSVSG